jgi:hypothetical protein
MRLTAPILSLVLAGALLGGCGGSSDTTGGAGAEPPATSTAPPGAKAQGCALDVDGIKGLRVTNVSCGEGQRLALAWQRAQACAKEGSRSGCAVRSYRCVATAAGRGWSVSCAKPGRSVAFTARRG